MEKRRGYSKQAIACFHDYQVWQIGSTSANSDAVIASGTNNEAYKEGPWMVAMTALEAYPSALCLNNHHCRPGYDNRSKRMPVAKSITMKIPVITTAQRIVR